MSGGLELRIPISVGEVMDKLTILEIKLERLSDAAQLENVRREWALVRDVVNAEVPRSAALDRLVAELATVNRRLWDDEDEIRGLERRKEFGPRFVEVARAVYLNNDRRAKLKREINGIAGSAIIEEKRYAPY